MQATLKQAAQVLRLLDDQGVKLDDLQDIFCSGVLSDVALAARLGRLPIEQRVTKNDRERELFRLKWLDAFGLGVYSRLQCEFTVNYDLPPDQLPMMGKTSQPYIHPCHFNSHKFGQVKVSGLIVSFRREMKLPEVRRWARYYGWTLAEPRELEALARAHDVSVECPVLAAGIVFPEGDGYDAVIGLDGAASLSETCRLERRFDSLSFRAGDSFLVIDNK